MPPLLHPTRYERRQPSRWRWIAAAVLTLLAQAVTVGLILMVSSVGGGSSDRATRPLRAVNMAELSAEDWERNRQVRQPSRSASESDPHEEPKPKEERPRGQVVATPEGNGERPGDSRWDAQSNNRVDKETRAANPDRNYRNPAAQRKGPQQSSSGARSTEVARQGDADGEAAEEQKRRGSGEPVVEVPSIQARDEIDAPDKDADGPGIVVAERRGSDELKGNSERLRILPGGGEEGDDATSAKARGGRSGLILTPSVEVLDEVLGAPAPDHLEDVEEGEGTFLNTREFKYSGFYNRIGQLVAPHWYRELDTRLAVRDPTGEIYGTRDRTTRLLFVLDDRGRLEDVRVVSSSGVEFLDVMAITAVRRGQPFPHPPPGLIDDDGKIRIGFGFTIEANRRGSFQIHRYRY